MPATVAAAVKTAIEGAGLGVPVYRGPGADAADGARFPRIEVHDGIASSRSQDGDTGDPNAVHTTVETLQIDVWQLKVVPNSDPPTRAEDYALVPNLERALSRMGHLGTFGTPARTVHGLVLRSSVNVADPTPNVLHRALTVDVYREI